MRTGDPVTAASVRLLATNSNGGSPWTGKIRADRHKARVHTNVPISAVQKLVAVAIVPMAASALALVLASDHLARPAASAVYGAYLVAASMAVGLYWWVARPASRFGPLLIAYGVCAWLVRLQGSNDPLIFDIGILAQAPNFVLTFYLFLAYPMGRLEPTAYTRFRRTLETGNLTLIRGAAAELPRVNLVDALAVCVAIRRAESERFERAALRWLARFWLTLGERKPSPDGVGRERGRRRSEQRWHCAKPARVSRSRVEDHPAA